jgi:hypothetical protein
VSTDDREVKNNGEGGTEMTEKTTGSGGERFVPTCSICGEKHWPHHQLIPCLNKNKAKAKARADKRAKAEAQKPRQKLKKGPISRQYPKQKED